MGASSKYKEIEDNKHNQERRYEVDTVLYTVDVNVVNCKHLSSIYSKGDNGVIRNRFLFGIKQR